MQVISTTPADNAAEAIAYLQSNLLNLKGEATGEVVYSGPYYPDMLKSWIEHAYEQTAAPKIDYRIVDASAVVQPIQQRKLEGRHLDTLEDGSTVYRYTI